MMIGQYCLGPQTKPKQALRSTLKGLQHVVAEFYKLFIFSYLLTNCMPDAFRPA